MRIRIAVTVVLMVLASAACGDAAPGRDSGATLPGATTTSAGDYEPAVGLEPTAGTPAEVGAGPFVEETTDFAPVTGLEPTVGTPAEVGAGPFVEETTDFAPVAGLEPTVGTPAEVGAGPFTEPGPPSGP